MGACVAVPARWEIESKIHSQEKQRDLTSESFLAQGDNRGSACSIMIIYSSKITHYHHTTTATPIHSLHITPTPTVHITNIPTPTYTSPTSLPQLTRHHHPYPTLHLTITPLPPNTHSTPYHHSHSTHQQEAPVPGWRWQWLGLWPALWWWRRGTARSAPERPTGWCAAC